MSPDSAGRVSTPGQLTQPAESGDIDYLKWVTWLIILGQFRHRCWTSV